FVAGHVALGTEGLELRPTCIVYESGPSRLALQPWIGDADKSTASAEATPHLPILAELRDALAQVLIAGLQRAGDPMQKAWGYLLQLADGLGLFRLRDRISPFSESLRQKTSQPHWDWKHLATRALILLALAKLGEDLSGT